jgi:hypothetical protein
MYTTLKQIRNHRDLWKSRTVHVQVDIIHDMFLADIKKICKHRELWYFVNQKISKIVIKSMEFSWNGWEFGWQDNIATADMADLG